MLTFNLKRKWFEKIKSGEKTKEYRIANDYWNKRLYHQWKKYRFKWTGIPVLFKLGYPKNDDTNKILKGYITGIDRLFDGLDTDLNTKEEVFEIRFELGSRLE